MGEYEGVENMKTLDKTNKIYCGNALDVLKKMPSEFIDCCVTSPPYWALRDYGTEGNIWDGDSNCEHDWSREIGRKQSRESPGVGAKQEMDGSLGNYCSKCKAWKGNLGLEPTFDLYIKHLCDIFDEVKRVLRKDGTCWVVIGDTYASGGGAATEQSWVREANSTQGHPDNPAKSKLRKTIPKSLIMIPFRFAIEMVNRGWILRNTIIWHKPNCMPASVKDRFTVDYEYVFFFTKNKKYYFEQQFEPIKLDSVKRERRGNKDNKYSKDEYFPEGVHANTMSQPREYKGYNDVEQECSERKGRNKRTVWNISTKPFKEAHFAVFPEDLIETPIRAGCPENGIVLDPFLGAGTTALVALKQSKKFIGIELNREYCKIANKRLNNFLKNH